MKKIITLVLVCILVLSVAGCGNNQDAGGEEGSVDFSKYPETLAEWTAEDMTNYFKEAGVFTHTEEEWYDSCPGTDLGMEGVEWFCSYADMMGGTEIIWIYSMDAESEDQWVQDQLAYIRENKTFNEDNWNEAVDTLIDGITFRYSHSINPDFVEAVEAALEQLTEEMGVTKDF